MESRTSKKVENELSGLNVSAIVPTQSEISDIEKLDEYLSKTMDATREDHEEVKHEPEVVKPKKSKKKPVKKNEEEKKHEEKKHEEPVEEVKQVPKAEPVEEEKKAESTKTIENSDITQFMFKPKEFEDVVNQISIDPRDHNNASIAKAMEYMMAYMVEMSEKMNKMCQTINEMKKGKVVKPEPVPKVKKTKKHSELSAADQELLAKYNTFFSGKTVPSNCREFYKRTWNVVFEHDKKFAPQYESYKSSPQVLKKTNTQDRDKKIADRMWSFLKDENHAEANEVIKLFKEVKAANFARSVESHVSAASEEMQNALAHEPEIDIKQDTDNE